MAQKHLQPITTDNKHNARAGRFCFLLGGYEDNLPKGYVCRVCVSLSLTL